MSTPKTPQSNERRSEKDRRQGIDRRQSDGAPPVTYERRHTIEPRQPDVAEIEMTPEELEALGFTQRPPGTQK